MPEVINFLCLIIRNIYEKVGLQYCMGEVRRLSNITGMLDFSLAVKKTFMSLYIFLYLKLETAYLSAFPPLPREDGTKLQAAIQKNIFSNTIK